MKRMISVIAAVILFAVLLTACGQTLYANEQKDTAADSASKDLQPETITVVSQAEERSVNTAEFYSADGSVFYAMSEFASEYEEAEFPVVRVRPHSITGEDAKALAGIIFPGQTFTEYSQELNRSEIEEKIRFWKEHLTEEELYKDFGPKAEDIELARSKRTAILNDYIQRLDTAPETIEKQECLWTYFPYSHYLDTAGMDFSGEKQNYCIEATTEVDGIPYFLWFYNSDPNQLGGLQNAFVYVDDHMGQTERYDLLCKLCGNEDPTPEQTSQARETAEDLLAKVSELTGVEWKIHTLEAEGRPLSDGRRIRYFEILALPFYADIEAMYLPSYARSSIMEKEGEAYYDFEQINIQLTHDGKLLRFEFSSPLDIIEIGESNTQILSAEETNQYIKSFFLNRKAEDYLPGERTWENIAVRTNINRYEIGWSRKQIGVSEYEFIPAVTVYGSYSVSDGKQEIWNSQNMLTSGDLQRALLVLSLIDGSIITTGI